MGPLGPWALGPGPGPSAIGLRLSKIKTQNKNTLFVITLEQSFLRWAKTTLKNKTSYMPLSKKVHSPYERPKNTMV